MNDLYAWLSQQHHGLRTFQIFQQKHATLSGDDPEQPALPRATSGAVPRATEAHHATIVGEAEIYRAGKAARDQSVF